MAASRPSMKQLTMIPSTLKLGIQDRKLDPAPQATVTVSDNIYEEFK